MNAPQVAPLTRRLDQAMLNAYADASGDHNPIHIDEAFARTKGFRAPLAQAMMSTAYVSELMTRFVGAGFVKGGTMSMTFIKPVLAGDRLTVRGVVKERRPEHGRTRVVVEVWCENQDGDKTAVGTASGLLD